MLKDIPLFSNLQEADIDAIAAHAVIKTFPKNTIVISEGDESTSLFVIQSGLVKVFLCNSEGKEVMLRVQGPGEYFGELALLDADPRSTSVMTLEPCQFQVISRVDFEKILEKNPMIACAFAKVLAQRVRLLTEDMRDMALLDVYGRVARALEKLALTQDGNQVIGVPLTHQQIANMVGASREMVTRVLRELSIGGYITIENKTITLEKKLPTSW